MHQGIRRLAGGLLAITLLAGLSACKILITVPEDIPGAVAAQSGSYYCLRTDNGQIDTDSICDADVVDIHFDETFVAIAAPGYIFSGWKKDHRYLCGGSRKPCRLATSGFEGNDKLLAILEDDQQEFYLEPVFTPGEVALTGDYEGTWTNVTFGSSGGISLSIVDNGDDTFDFTLDLDGNVFGQGDPGPVSITADLMPNGEISSFGQVTIGGTATPYEFVLDKNTGELALYFPNLPLAGFKSFEIRGSINGGTGFFEYQIRFDGSAPALGTASLYKP